jgi:hypothetical protein
MAITCRRMNEIRNRSPRVPTVPGHYRQRRSEGREAALGAPGRERRPLARGVSYGSASFWPRAGRPSPLLCQQWRVSAPALNLRELREIRAGVKTNVRLSGQMTDRRTRRLMTRSTRIRVPAVKCEERIGETPFSPPRFLPVFRNWTDIHRPSRTSPRRVRAQLVFDEHKRASMYGVRIPLGLPRKPLFYKGFLLARGDSSNIRLEFALTRARQCQRADPVAV